MQECIQGFKSLSLRQIHGFLFRGFFSLQFFTPNSPPYFVLFLARAIAFYQPFSLRFLRRHSSNVCNVSNLTFFGACAIQNAERRSFLNACAYTYASALYYLLRKSIYKVARAYTAPFYRLFLVLIFYVIVHFLSQ